MIRSWGLHRASAFLNLDKITQSDPEQHKYNIFVFLSLFEYKQTSLNSSLGHEKHKYVYISRQSELPGADPIWSSKHVLIFLIWIMIMIPITPWENRGFKAQIKYSSYLFDYNSLHVIHVLR